MANANVTVTTAANFIPEIWSTEVLEAYVAELVFGALVDRKFEADVKQSGDTIHVPNLAAMTVGSKTAETAVTFTANTESVTDISINKDYYVAFRIDNIAEVQSQNNLRQMYTARAGKDIAVQIDDSLAALVDAFSQSVGTLAVDVTDDNLLRAVQYLDDANAPKDDRSLVISPATFGSLMKIDKFVRLDYVNAGAETAVEASRLSYPIYGAKVYVSANVDGDNTNGHDNGLFQKEALALVMQQEPKVFSQFMIEYISDAVVVEAIWGVKEMRDTSGVWVKGK
jgi:hypothetical protein